MSRRAARDVTLAGNQLLLGKSNHGASLRSATGIEPDKGPRNQLSRNV
jgi:hypothetical protein